MTVLTDLVLVRHAEATCNVSGIVGGPRGCTGLTAHGREQAQRLGARLLEMHRTRPFTAAYDTPRLRVRQTADIVAAHLDLPVVTRHDLRGLDHGTADGRPWQEIKTRFAGPPQHRPDEPIAPGAEPWNAYLDRAGTALSDILSAHTGEAVLVIAHGETIDAAHTRLLDTPRTGSAAGFWTDHTGLTRWQQHRNRFGRTVWTMICHNDTAHLRCSPAHPGRAP